MLLPKYRTKPDGTRLSLHEMCRHNHTLCGDTRQRLYVKFTGKGWLYHCHNCGDACSGFQRMKNDKGASPNNVLLLADHRKKQGPEATRELALTYSRTLPRDAKRWVAQYGILDTEMQKYKIGYHEKSNRVILPVFASSGAMTRVGYRKVTKGRKNRYIEKVALNRSITTHFKIRDPLRVAKGLVLVEDMLSAIKVGREYDVLCLHGSFVSKYLHPYLDLYDILYIWLDEDKYSTGVKQAKELSSLGHMVRVIKTKEDPKCHSQNDIRKIIEKSS